MQMLKKTKGGRTAAEEANVRKEFYFDEGYFSEVQFISFAQQLRLVRNLRRRNILEVGKGNGFVSDFLKKAGYNVKTVDVNHNLRPDVVGSVLDLAGIFKTANFDVVLCAEVLEHLPFEFFERAIVNIFETTNAYAVITLPRCEKSVFEFQLSVKFFQLPPVQGSFFVSMPWAPINEHHWELNSNRLTKMKSIRHIIKRYFTVIDEGRMRSNPYHHYFVLSKRTT